MTVNKQSNYPQEVSLNPSDKRKIISGEELFVIWTAGEVQLTNKQAKQLIADDHYRKVHASGTFVEGPCSGESGNWQVYKLSSFPEHEIDALKASAYVGVTVPHIHAFRENNMLEVANARPLQKKNFKFHETELRRLRAWLNTFKK